MNERSSGFRRRRRDTTVEMLLGAAETVIARTGYDAVTMGQIARAAGCATGTLYRYFRDKQELVTALVERHGRIFRGRVGAAMAGTPDPLEKIRRSIRTFLEYFGENRNYFKVLFASNLLHRGVLPGALPKAEQEERKRLQAAFLQVIRQAQARGRIRRDFPPEEIQKFMRSYVLGMMDQLSLLETLPPADDLLRTLWAFMTGGMGAAKQGR